MTNPFRFGQVVTGEHFTDREKEIEEISRELKQEGRVFLISPRRYGKTSLVANILEGLRRQGMLTAHLDLYDASTLEQFATHYARALARASETKAESLVRFIREAVPALRPQVTLSPEGDISVGVDVSLKKRDLSLVLKDLFEIPEKVAARKGRRFVVSLDEFQEVVTLGGEPLEKLMRSSFQRQPHVSYIFSGSKKGVMAEMVSDKSRAFYKMGSVRWLDKIPGTDLARFIEERFKSTGPIELAPGVIPAILKASRGIPYYVQQLCHEMWNGNLGRPRIGEASVVEAASAIVSGQSNVFLSIWDSLTLHQRHVLQAISVHGGTSPFSQGFIQGARLGSASSVQKSLKLLVGKNILERENGEYSFSDVWFGEWVKQRA